MKVTSCAICTENFTSYNSYKGNKAHSRQPLILKCGHTFCEICISQKLKKTKSNSWDSQITCHTCQKVTTVENGIKDLPVNVYLTAFIGINQRAKLDLQLGQLSPASRLFTKAISETNAKKCQMCKENNCTCQCKECENFLCFTCFTNVHTISASIKDHKPVPFGTIAKPEIPKASSKIARETTCSDHARPIEYFCLDDSSCICSRCYILGNHKNHSIISFEEKNKQIISEIENELPSVTKVLSHLKNIDKKLVTSLPNAKNETKAVIDQINLSFLKLHALLQTREMELIDSLTLAFKEKCFELVEKKQMFQNERIALEEAVRDAMKLIENNALIVDGNALLEVLKSARSIPCVIVKKDLLESESESIHWEETYSSDLIQAINSYGGFTGQFHHKIGFKTVEEVPDSSFELDSSDIVSVGSAASVSSLQSIGEVSVSSDISTAPDSAGEDVLVEGDDMDIRSDRGKIHFREPIDKLIVKGPQQQVMVTHIRSPNDFYVQLTSNKHKLTTLSHNINTWCRRKASVKHVPLVVEKNMYVLACYSADKLWYRAQVLDVEMPSGQKGDEGLKVRVHYIDYGNEELVAVKDLRAMEKRFATYPVFAVRCSLINFAPYADDKTWSVEAIQEFLQMTQNKVFLLSTFAKQGELHEVDLVIMPTENVQDDGFVSLRDVMIFLELGRFRTYSDAAKNNPLPPSYKKVDFIKPTALKSNKSVDVIVTSVTSPWDFFVVSTGLEQEYYLTMLEHMQDMYGKDSSNIYALYYPREGMVCSVKGENGKWYRGKVLGTSHVKQVTVKYVDTGLIEVIHIDRLKKLHSDFLKLPAQAINCKLADVHPIGTPDIKWSSEAEIWFQNMLTGTELCVKVIRGGDLPEVVLWLDIRSRLVKSSLSVNYKLVEMSFAASTGLTSTAAAQQSLVGSPVELKNENVLRKWDNLSQSNGDISHPAHPTFQLGLKTPDSSSVSKRIKERTPPSTNFAEVIQPDKTPGANAPPSAQRGKRGKGIEIKIETTKQKEKIGQSTGHKISHKPQSSSLGETAATSPETEKEKIQREIHRAMSSSEETLSTDSPSSVYIEVLVINYKSPSDFFIRIQDREHQLQELMVDMQSIYDGSQSEVPHQWRVNDYCAARYSVDKLWYRCIIKNKVADEYEVEMVDFGYCDKVNKSELRILKQDLGTRLECSAVRCHLADLIPAGSVDVNKWSCTAVEFMASQIKDKNLYIKQEGDLNAMGLPIDIIVEEVIPETAFEPTMRTYHSLRQNILKEGLAMPAKKSTNSNKETDKDSASFQKVIFERGPGELNGNFKPSASHTDGAENSCFSVTGSEEFEDIDLPDLNETLKPLSFVSDNEGIGEYVPVVTMVPQVPKLEVGSELLVIPTHVTADCQIYCQPEIWVQQAVGLAENLLKLYGLWEPQVTKQPVTKWKIGDYCVSPFEDDLQWYRATITNIDGDNAQVFYYDFGNSAWVNLGDLRLMHPLLNDVHTLSYKFVIHDIKPFPSLAWEPATVREMSQQLLSFECFVKVKEVNVKENIILVDIIRSSDQLNLKDYVVNTGAAICCSDDRHLYVHSGMIGRALHSITDCPRLSMGKIGSTFRGLITSVERPDVIYLQRSRVDPSAKLGNVAWNQRISQFEALMEDINKQTTALFEDMPTEEGFLLEGQFTVDNRWYRAIIVKAYPLNKLCMVTYFDFGTTEVLPSDRLRPIHTSIKYFPVMAWRCHLPILPPKQAGQWTQNILHGVTKILFGQEALVQIVKLKPRTVTLFDETSNQYIIQTIFELGFGQPDDAICNVVVADVGDDQTERLCTVAGIKCHLTKSEEEEIEMIVSGRVTLPESAVDVCNEEPFWNVGFESILNAEERKQMVVFLARKALSIKMTEFASKISGQFVATEPGKESLDSPNVTSEVIEGKTQAVTAKVETGVIVDNDSFCDDDDTEWTSDEEETLSENDNHKSQNDGSIKNIKGMH